MKNFCFFVFFLFFVLNLFSQDIQKDLETGINYYKKEQYQKAIPLLEPYLPVVKESLGDTSQVYITLLYYVSDCYHKTNNEEKAKQYATELQKYIKTDNNSNKDSENSNWETLNQQVIQYYKAGDYDKAIFFAEKALIEAEKELGKTHNNYAKSLNNLAFLYNIMGNYTKAETLYLESVQINEQQLGKDHEIYATSLNNLAQLYQSMDNFPKAELLYMEAMRIRKNALGKEHPDYATSLGCLAGLYESMSNYLKAEPLYKEAMKICEKALGKEHPSYATYVNNLAGLYESMGNYSKAELLYLESMKIREKQLGKDHPDYAGTLNNLALLYKSMSNYEKAEPLYIEAMKIWEKSLGKEHPYYATCVNNLAGLYENMGNHKKAEQLYIEAMKIREKALGKEHSDYATSLNNLALLYESMSNYEKAEPLYIEAMNIIEKALGKEHPSYATCVNNLAAFYDSMGNHEKADSLYLEAMRIIEIAQGKEHPSYATSLNNLASLYTTMGIYAKAEPLCLEAMKIREKALGKEHTVYATSLNNFAVLYCRMGTYAKAEPLLFASRNVLFKQIDQNFSFMSEKEKELFIKQEEVQFEFQNSFALLRQKEKPSINSIVYENELYTKGMILSSSTGVRNAILQSGDTTSIKNYDEFILVRKMLAKLYTLPIANRKINVDSLENVANELEKKFTRSAQNLPEFQKALELKKANWQSIQQKLKPDEASIEFSFFNFHNGKKITDSTLYCASILRPGFKNPLLVPLFEQKELQTILENTKLTDEGFVSSLYASRGVGVTLQDDGQTKRWVKLYQLVWQKIDSALQGVKTVYFAPTGLLHKISFAAMPYLGDTINVNGDTLLLSDKYNLVQMTSTRFLMLSNRSEYITQTEKALLYGGIEFNMDSAAMVVNAKQWKTDENTSRSMLSTENRGGVWNYLPGTLKESQNIEKLFSAKKVSYTLLSEKGATEESFKLLDKTTRPSIIHFATHGFFFSDVEKKNKDDLNRGFLLIGDERNKFQYSENPLLRSGLIMAGANRVWSGKEPIEGVDDGILTAMEVSNLYLPTTKLVVMSACETGLGDIKGGEGVFGLQRSFKMAGVHYIVMSLWKVPDAETMEMMTYFYTNILNGMEIREGFKSAQNKMKKKYKNNPYLWAAFVLTE